MASNRGNKKKPDDPPDQRAWCSAGPWICVVNVIKNVHLRVSLFNVICVAFWSMLAVKTFLKAIKSLSGLDNVIYYCRNNNCRNRIKYITSEWVKSQDTSEVEELVTNLTQQHISKEYESIQKAVSDLSSKIIHLQAQESDLCTQIKNTAVALDTHPKLLHKFLIVKAALLCTAC